jgi:hypothetical protein
MVKSAERYYALTAQHVIGPPGTVVLSAFDAPNSPLRGIGVATDFALTSRT